MLEYLYFIYDKIDVFHKGEELIFDLEFPW